MYAVVDIKGFQYKLQKGDKLKVPKYDLEIGKKITIPDVLLFSSDKEIKVGTPFVEGAVVSATVTGQGKYKKITVFKKKKRKDYSVKRGHRQEFTEILINNIRISKVSSKKAVSKATKEKEVEVSEAKVSEKVKEKKVPETGVTDVPIKKGSSPGKKAE